ncbi:hypothetical protein CANCADRAFT_30634 [Tortispora caseinolytica NRRL Y-17796]|uniref:Uncharacterized protein n=1 Tax=Tortispora caseinolytica NRRL Y-17796 TaxID=767744 RepID=A0A1E4TL80_9ASCO|nr:hypothetical protein CANCADRAFT_30634 [Tortispora caseinolytica NRRL Y-17796]
MRFLIVGSSRGIGLAITKELLSRGHSVIATTRSEVQDEVLTELSAQYPGKLVHVTLDVVIESSIDRAVSKIDALAKEEHIDWALIVAGWALYPGAVIDVSFEDMLKQVKINTVGPLYVAQKLIPIVNRSETKGIAVLSSDSGSVNRFLGQEEGLGVYGISKVGLNHGMRHLEQEAKRRGINLKMLCIHPGVVKTDMLASITIEELDESTVIDTTTSAKGVTDLLLIPRANGFYEWTGAEYPW